MNEISRRRVVAGIAAGLPLAMVLADPKLAHAAASKLRTVRIHGPGGKLISAALAKPKAKKAPAVLLVHEWWGLNDQIKAVAAEFANQGYLALAIDLYGGKAAADGDRDGAKALMQTVTAESGEGITAAWLDWLRTVKSVSGKIGTVGWCFGGGWSLNASIVRPAEATVIYYGRVNRKAADLAKLKGPVLGHFALKDQNINKPMVEGFEAEMKKAGKTFTTHWYDADHAFANPTGARYNEPDAKLAWERTTAFFKKHLA
ncbi:MAG: dienelactone hydrolase family protein [Proteobacteria bacterium]|nr:dienelactone hydrolase family protein [Pseudomonadota bacterium]